MEAKQLWETLKQWLQENKVPDVVENLNPGATLQEFVSAENILSVKFPMGFKEVYTIHNGQNGKAVGLHSKGELLSLQEIVRQWQIWKELVDDGVFKDAHSESDDPIKSDWWNPKWIPFTHNGGGDHLCLDFDPAEGGLVGQVITMWHDSRDRSVIAPSFEKWLEEYCNDLLANKYHYNADFGVESVSR